MLLCAIPLNSLQAQGVGELRLFYKCHGQLLKSRPTENSILLQKIKSGEINAAEACGQLLDLGSLNPDTGSVGMLPNSSQPEPQSARVLRTLHEEHTTWFPGEPEFNECISGSWSHLLYEKNEAALFVTRALFSKDTRFDSIVKDKITLRARRFSNIQNNGFNQGRGQSALIHLKEDHNTMTPLTLPFLEMGQLYGIQEAPEMRVPASIFTPGTTNLTEAAGAGLLGSRWFIMNNAESYVLHPTNTQPPQGARRLPRRLAKGIMEQLLCSELPTLSPADALPYVHPERESPQSFRNGVSCMQCHASMDQMARVYRGVKISFTSSSCHVAPNSDAHVMHFRAQTKSPHPNENSGWIDVDDSDYPNRPPEGRLFYKSFDGTLIDVKLDGVSSPDANGGLDPAMVGVAQLGKALANTRDFYACAAKRYLKFFTDIDVSLHQGYEDEGKMNAYKNFVIRLGDELKEHQNLSKTIRSIFQSEAYKYPQGGRP